MSRHNFSDSGRREFLKRLQALSVAGSAAPWALNLAAMGEASAADATGYKALVCVFLYGGNDYANTLVPYDATSHASYIGIRGDQTKGGIGILHANLDATALTPSVALPDGYQYALAPDLAPLKPLFDGGQLAVLLNVGTLVEPLASPAEYRAGAKAVPPKLFSHNDQQSYWQSSNPEGATSGWGGRIGDILASGNGQSIFTNVTAAGNAVFLSGNQTAQYAVGLNGAVSLRASSKLFGSAANAQVLHDLIVAPSAQWFESDYSAIVQRSLGAGALLTPALNGVTLTTTFDKSNSLAMQLQIVAKLIAARSALGAKRQVFFVSLGGFDNHDFLLTQHPVLMGKLAGALTSFYQATLELGVSEQVTTFTASDFGRTLASNGDGSDHGWGSHHFVLGGAVKGGRYYGKPPVVAVGGPDDVGQGRLLPSTSVDQLGATLAHWMGVAPTLQTTDDPSTSALADVLPNIGNFAHNWDLRLFG